MKNLMKKIVVSIVGLSMIVMMAPVAQAVTVAELQAQIASLTAQLAALQAQLTTLTGAPAAAACTFTRNLYPGMSGADVKCLQQYLNGAGYAVAASGAGSAGNETQYFGPLTQAAVKKWQDANGVVYGAYGGYFGPLSQAKYTALAVAAPPAEEEEVPSEITTPGAEGSIIATIAPTPASGAEVYIKATNVGVTGVEVKATGSDVLVKRFDVNFNKRPWLYIKNLIITDGTTSKTIAVTEADTAEVTVGSSYTVRVEGLSFLIPKDTTKTLTVNVDGADALPSGVTSQDVVVTIDANAIRGVDGAAVSQYAPTAALSTRTFTAKAGDTANLEITAHADNPKARAVVVQSTAETTGVTLAKLNVKATNNAAILRTVKFEDATASSTLKTVYLYDGDTLLSSTSSITTSSSTLANVDLTIPKDTTKVLILKGDLYKASGYYVTGETADVASSTITLVAEAASFDAEDATTYATATVTGSTVAPGSIYFFQKAPSLALVSASINSVSVATGTITYNGKADARVKINVTASGGDIYVASGTTNALNATTTIAASSTVVQSITSNADTTSGYENWVVRSGETKWFEIYAQLTRVDDAGAVGPDLATYMYTEFLEWASAADPGGAAVTYTQTWGLTDFKTGSVVLEYFR